MLRAVLAIGVLFGSSVLPSAASARQPEPLPAPGEATVAVAPWLGLGAAFRRDGTQLDAAVDFAFDLGVTWSVLDARSAGVFDSRIRLGPWFQVRTGSFQSLDLTLGARLFFGGAEVEWFKAPGRWGFHLDLGASHAWRRQDARSWEPRQYSVVARLAWGYRTVYPTSFEDYGGYDPSKRERNAIGIERGLRVVATFRQSIEGSGIWEASLGLETELSGAGVWLASLF